MNVAGMLWFFIAFSKLSIDVFCKIDESLVFSGSGYILFSKQSMYIYNTQYAHVSLSCMIIVYMYTL